MTDHMKHWIDILAGLLAVISSIANPILTIVSGAMAIAWYSVRFYDRFKGKQ